MEEWARWIAGNPFLQAIAIVVAVGTLIFFLWSTIPIAYRTLLNFLRYGAKRALRIALRPAARMAREASFDHRLLIICLFELSVEMFTKILFVPMGYLILILLNQIFSEVAPPPTKLPDVWQVFVIVTISAIASTLVSIFFIRPVFMFWYVIIFTRRQILRELRRKWRNRKREHPA